MIPSMPTYLTILWIVIDARLAQYFITIGVAEIGPYPAIVLITVGMQFKPPFL